MIYFFHKKEDVQNHHEKDNLTWYSKRIKEEKDLCEVYKWMYDMADYIYDKRFDGGDVDTELNSYVNSHSYSGSAEGKKGKVSYLRLRALKILLEEIDTYHPDSEEPLEQVLFCLAKGNICLRISHCYIHYFDHANSDKYGNQAQELLWRGKQMASRIYSLVARDNGNQSFSGKRQLSLDECEMYIRTLKLNLAKFHRNFAQKNRRSDFDAALDEYHHICEKIQARYTDDGGDPVKLTREAYEAMDEGERKNRNAEWFRNLPCELKRKYALLWLDAEQSEQ